MRSREEIDAALNDADEQVESGRTRWMSMSYEEGVAAALRWVTGDSDDHPMED